MQVMLDLVEEYIDMLQERSKDSVYASYIKTNPITLQKAYSKAIDNVKINMGNDKKQIKTLTLQLMS